MNSIQRIIIAALLITTAGITTATVSGTAVAEAESDIHWTGSGANGPTITQDIQVAASDEPISFGADTGRSLRIKNIDTGENITLTPTNTTAYEVSEFELNFNSLVNNLGDGEYRKADEPEMTLSTNKSGTIPFYPLKVEGDPTAFYDNTFYNYNVQLLDGSGTIIAQTSEPRFRATGYNVSYEYNGSAVAVTRDSEVKSDWYVQLEQDEEIATADNTVGDDYFVFDVRDTDFSPNETFRARIFPDETRTTLDYAIVTLFTVGGFEDAGSDPKLTIVDGPVGGTDDSSSAPEESPSEDGGIVSYAGSDDIVGPSGLGDAAADFRAGEIGPGTLGEVAAAFRSGEPVV